MGKLTGGPFGVLIGKTSGLNFKYSGGQNIASKYVPNPRNPMTGKQITRRSIFKKQTQPFTSLDSVLINLAFNKKTLHKSANGLISHQLSQGAQQILAGQVPARSWFVHMWRVIVDELRGQDKGIGRNIVQFLPTSLMFDRNTVALTQQSATLLLTSLYGLNLSGKIVELPEFINRLPFFNVDYDQAPFGFWLCRHVDDVFNEDLDEWEVVGSESINSLWGTWSCSVQLKEKKKDDEDVVSEVSKHQPPHYVTPKSGVNSNNYIMPFGYIKDYALSKRLGCSGLVGHENINVESLLDITMIPNWQLNKTDFNVEVIQNGASKDITVIYDGVIPAEFEHESYKLVVLYANSSNLFNGASTMQEGGLNEGTISFSIADNPSTQILRMLFYVVIDGTHSSFPLRYAKKVSTGLATWSADYFYYNETPFRYKSFSEKYNLIGKLQVATDDFNVEFSDLELDFVGTNETELFTLHTDSLGCFAYNLLQDTFIDYIRFSYDGEVIKMHVDKIMKADENNEIGIITPPSA